MMNRSKNVWQGQKQIHERLPNWKTVAPALQRTFRALCWMGI